jgi:hypothetical protein
MKFAVVISTPRIDSVCKTVREAVTLYGGQKVLVERIVYTNEGTQYTRFSKCSQSLDLNKALVVERYEVSMHQEGLPWRS